MLAHTASTTTTRASLQGPCAVHRAAWVESAFFNVIGPRVPFESLRTACRAPIKGATRQRQPLRGVRQYAAVRVCPAPEVLSKPVRPKLHRDGRRIQLAGSHPGKRTCPFLDENLLGQQAAEVDRREGHGLTPWRDLEGYEAPVAPCLKVQLGVGKRASEPG